MDVQVAPLIAGIVMLCAGCVTGGMAIGIQIAKKIRRRDHD